MGKEVSVKWWSEKKRWVSIQDCVERECWKIMQILGLPLSRSHCTCRNVKDWFYQEKMYPRIRCLECDAENKRCVH